MSHEMRSPLNVIVGFSELLEQRALEEPDIRNLRFSSLQLLNLINDVLDLSAIEAGKIVFEHTPFDLVYTVNTVFKALEQRATDKGLTWSSSLPSDLPAPLHGDAGKAQSGADQPVGQRHQIHTKRRWNCTLSK